MAISKLHQLIKSLSMSEKRYFKLFSKKHVIGDGNNYVQLFDLLDGQKEYDINQLKKSKYVKNLAAEKNYLYNLILKSLNTFHANISTKTKIYQLLHNVEILFQKGLYDQCDTLLKKARKLAEPNQLDVLILAINEFQEEIFSKQLDYDASEQTIQENERVIERLNNFYAIQTVTTRNYKERITTGGARETKHVEAIKKLLDTPLIKDEKSALSYRALLFQHSLHLSYYNVVKDHKEAIKYNARIIDLYETQPILVEQTPVGYITSLYNLSNSYQESGNDKEAYALIDKLLEFGNNEIVKSAPIPLARIFFLANNLKLHILLKLNKFNEGIILYNKIIRDIPKHAPTTPKPMVYDMYFMLAKLFFYQEDYKIALKYTNDILNDLKFKVREDMISIIRLFNLIVHHELGNSFTMDYLANSTFQYFRRKNRLFQVEYVILKFLQRHHKLNDKKEKKAHWQELHDDLAPLTKDAFESRAFHFFPFDAWVTSKINNASLTVTLLQNPVNN